MEKVNNLIVKRLQAEAKQFLSETKLLLNGIVILPKEIEVYYYKNGVFMDEAVHKNELQQNNKNHFYIHRLGVDKTSSYKGGNRAGLDYVVSDESNTFYSYLIRSAVINNELTIGPNKVLNKILELSSFHKGIAFQEIEKAEVEIVFSNTTSDVLFSNRINITKGFMDCDLRAVICDEWYRNAKYPKKEDMIINNLIHNYMPTLEQALEFSKKYLGYVPSKVRNYYVHK